MNIAIASNFKANYSGNFIKQILLLRNWLIENGHQVIFIFPEKARDRDWAKELANSGVKLIFSKNNFGFREYIRFMGFLFSNDINIIHTNFGFYDLISAITSLLKSNLHAIVHVHAESTSSTHFLRKGMKKVKLGIVFKKTAVIAVSNNIREEYIRAGCLPERIKLIPNGINFLRLTGGNNRITIRKKFCIKEDETCFLLMGYNFEVKGVDLVCRQFLKMHEGIACTRKEKLIIVAGSNYEKVKCSITALCGDFPEWLLLLPPNEAMGEYYRLADCFVSASISEGFSYSLCEALSQELPAIISDIEGTSWASEFESVITFKSGSPESLWSAFQEFSKGRHKQFVTNTASIVKARYNEENWLKKVIEVYQPYLS